MLFLFWNLKKLPRGAIVAEIAAHYDVDVVMLAECEISEKDLLSALSGRGLSFHKPWCIPGKIEILSRLPKGSLTPVRDDPTQRLSVRRLLHGQSDILLAVVHFQSKVNWTEDEQAAEAQNLAREIVKAEKERGHQRTVLVGDLNMNPFEAGVSSSHGLHAVMTRSIAQQRTRVVASREYSFFYNPMWGHFGDRTTGPSGTHFYRSGKPYCHFWNMFDQVLIRPDLIDRFTGRVEILDSSGSQSLLTDRGVPDESVGSDHLPLLFELEL